MESQHTIAREATRSGPGVHSGKTVKVVIRPAAAGEDPYRAFDYVHLLALGGVPAASVPAGTQDGLPLGIQVAAAPFREDLVLAAAGAIESRLGPAAR